MTIKATTWAQELQNQVTGSILTPDHPDYEKTRHGWNLSLDHHPAVILLAETKADIQAGVRFAKETGLGVIIRSTGHGMQLPADESSFLIVTTEVNGVQVDGVARTARAEAGARWHQVVEKAAEFGLAPLLGSSPHVGVLGYTLGGGIGWLARKYGLAVDSVRSVEIVTADGEFKRLSADENSDLFWGVCGGGGNFGVVTEIEFDLYPVARLYGGGLIYPGDAAAGALRFFRDWVKTVPDEMTSSITIVKFPDWPQLPDPIRGKTQVRFRAAYIGDPAEGEALIQPWLDWKAPLQNTFTDMPFSKVGDISQDPVDPVAGYGSSEMLDEISDEALEVIIQYATDRSLPFVGTEFRHAGGAIADVPVNANAISNRDAEFYMVIGGPAPTPELYNASKAAVMQFKAAMKPYTNGGVYLNFMHRDEAANRVQDAFLQSYDRLVELKAQYDPENLFRYSYQIVPIEK
jgi:FAD/FMN-containing dehydrogenase